MSTGAWNGAVMTHKEIGDIIGMHKNNVCTLEKQALRKVKEYLLRRFGDRVTIEDLIPYYKEEDTEYEMPRY